MKTLRTTSWVVCLAVASLLTAPTHAGPRHGSHATYAKVVEVRPVYQRITRQVPEEYCHYETHAYRDSRGSSYTGTVAGGIVGAALGYELGNSKRNKDVGAVIGGVLGASIGHDLTRNSRNSGVRYEEREICQTRYQTQHTERVTGYDVTYKHRGQYYQTRSSRHPGDRIVVDVHRHTVVPAFRYR